MAIEVLVRRELRWDCTCRECSSQLRFAKEDAKWDYGGYNERTCITLKCPVCDSTQYYGTEDIKKV